MPLSREMCQRLADAYPEVWACHELTESRGSRERGYPGYWHTEDRTMDNDVWWSEANGRDILGYVPDYTAPTGKPLWCPRLEDLLDVAAKAVGTGSIDLCSHAGAATGQPWWECGHINEDGDGVYVTAGDTPEEAVANWLLQQAEGGAT